MVYTNPEVQIHKRHTERGDRSNDGSSGRRRNILSNCSVVDVVDAAGAPKRAVCASGGLSGGAGIDVALLSVLLLLLHLR